MEVLLLRVETPETCCQTCNPALQACLKLFIDSSVFVSVVCLTFSDVLAVKDA